jgi:hypothetical protein
MSNPQTFDIESDWVHIQYPETSAFRDVYGFASQSGMVNIEGIRLRPKGKPSKTLLFYMHPASTLQILPVPKSMAAGGAHVLCAGSRYARNDTPLIMEKVLMDIAAYFRHHPSHTRRRAHRPESHEPHRRRRGHLAGRPLGPGRGVAGLHRPVCH